MERAVQIPKTIQIDTIARAGYLARAVVYFLTGTLAFMVAVGSRFGTTTDSKGSLRQLLEQPFGELLLAILAVGLFSYSVWRAYQVVKDPMRWGSSAKGIVKRIGCALGGIAYFSLSVYAVRLIFDLSTQAGSEQSKAKLLLSLPFGWVITALIGAGIVLFGISEIVNAFGEKFCKHVAFPPDKKATLTRVCKFGLSARGLVFVMIGTFFIQAGFHLNSSEAGGVTKAWEVLRGLPYGDQLLAVVAAGFIAFAVFGATEARYRKLPSDMLELGTKPGLFAERH